MAVYTIQAHWQWNAPTWPANLVRIAIGKSVCHINYGLRHTTVDAKV